MKTDEHDRAHFCRRSGTCAAGIAIASRKSTFYSSLLYCWLLCWQAPGTDPQQIYRGDGAAELLARRRCDRRATSPCTSADMRGRIANSILSAIKAYTPPPFTSALGAVVAGHMFAICLNSRLVRFRLGLFLFSLHQAKARFGSSVSLQLHTRFFSAFGFPKRIYSFALAPLTH